MKKMIALLLCAAMVLSMTACAENTDTTTGSAEDQTTVVPDTMAQQETTVPAPTRESRLVYGTAARFDGDFAAGLFSGSARDIMSGDAAASLDEQTADEVIGDLLMDYGTMALQPDGTYAYNMTVLAKEPTAVNNADGSRTYTLQIKEDLTYNTGKAITARDYIFKILFVNSAACAALDGRGYDGTDYPNGSAFYNCETAVFSDIRLMNDYTWSVTITEEKADYMYAFNYVTAEPWDVEYWLGTGYSIADSGQGCYLAKDGQAVVMDLNLANAVSANFIAARSGQVVPMVTAGPYQLASYDDAAKEVTLKRNPNYIGNFEGQMPSIETLVVTCVEKTGWEDDLENGTVHLVDTIEDGSIINAVQEMIDQGAEFALDVFDRAGYGKLQFICDITPTQFVEVRQAIAHLVDREAIVDLYCQGWGNVVNGPYNAALWMAQESAELFAKTMEDYEYSVKAAERLLEQGGWNLDEYGDPWVGDGLRYKEVTEEQAAYMDECIEVGDTILMPLIIKWSASENNLVTDLLNVLLVQSEEVAALGMEIQVDEMDFTSMLGYLYRQDIYGVGGKDFSEPCYSMFNLALGWESAQYDCSYNWSGDDTYVAAGYNSNYLYDLGEAGLDQLSMNMVYGIGENDRAAYLSVWQKYIIRYNQLLPDLPLYANRYATVYPTWLKGYDQDSFWGFQNAILYASVAE